jgi:glucose/arabinose dehydrogenase
MTPTRRGLARPGTTLRDGAPARERCLRASDGVRILPLALTLAASAGIVGCFAVRGSHGGGQTHVTAEREVAPNNVAVPQGYVIDVVARGLTFPSGVAFDDDEGIYVVETGYSYGEVWTVPRLLRIAPDGGAPVEIAHGGDNGPWDGVAFANGRFYVSEGGRREGGRILAIDRDGRIQVLAQDLPSRGDHQTNGPAIGPDGEIYFGIGTATNSGVVGEDNQQFGWLRDHPDFHDIPCVDVTLRGQNFPTRDVRDGHDKHADVETGAFSAFGTPTTKGQIIHGQVPCSGAVFRIPADGGTPTLVAWGFRNPFGLCFSPDGALYVSDNSYDVRGSRPVYGTGDLLWKVTTGTWYGWPDYHGTRRVDDGDHFRAPGEPDPKPLLEKTPNPPQEPVAVLPVHSSSDGFDFSFNPEFGHVGEAFIAQFGDQAPTTGKVLLPVGFKVVRVDVTTGVSQDFAVNRGAHNGPASKNGGSGFERPIAAHFDRTGRNLYVVDFGVLVQDEKGSHPHQGTGCLWRIRRSADAGGAVASTVPEEVR